MNKLLKNNKDGFTLLEVLFSVVILAVGLLGVAAMQVTAIKGNSYGNKLNIATELIENQMEAFRNMPYDDIGDISLAAVPEDELPEVPGSINYQREAKVEDGPISGDSKKITVTVKWTDNDSIRNHQISVSTIVSD